MLESPPDAPWREGLPAGGLFGALIGHARRSPRAPALTDGGGTVSYGDLPALIAEAGRRLDEWCPGFGPVALCFDNCIAWAVLELALLSLGRVAVAIPTSFTPEQRAHAVQSAGADYLIGGGPADRMLLGRALRIDAGRRDGQPPVLPPGTAKIAFAPDEFGTQRAICLALAGLEGRAASVIDRIGAERQHCAILPLALLLEAVAGFYPTLMSGGHCIVPAPAVIGLAEPFLPDCARLAIAPAALGATGTIMTPRLLRGVMTALRRTGLSLPHLRLVTVGRISEPRRLTAEAAELGMSLVLGYANRRLGSVAALGAPPDTPDDALGRALPQVVIEAGDNGELRVRDPLFLGYADHPALPSFLSTGDFGTIDDAGHVRLCRQQEEGPPGTIGSGRPDARSGPDGT